MASEAAIANTAMEGGGYYNRNSMRPMRLAIETLRSRVGANRAIEVVHTDLPSKALGAQA